MDGRHKERTPRGRLGAAWKGLVPVGVATAAALVIGGGMDVVHRHRIAEETEHAAKPAAKKQRTEPRFVVGVRTPGTAVVVRDVRTGEDVGLPVAASNGRRFQRIASAGERSYIVASYAARKVTFQRLKLEKDGRPKELSELPKATVAGASTAWSDLAVTPDGKTLAYVTYRGARARVDVVSLSGGARKTWTTRAAGRVGSLSWAGGRLSFVWTPYRRVNGRATALGHQVRVIDTAAPSGDLKASKPVLKLPKGTGVAVISKDGRTVVTGVPQRTQIAFQAYSTETGRPTKVLWRQDAAGRLARLVPDRTGGHLLASVSDGHLYAQGTRALPGKDLADAAW